MQQQEAAGQALRTSLHGHWSSCTAFNSGRDRIRAQAAVMVGGLAWSIRLRYRPVVQSVGGIQVPAGCWCVGIMAGRQS